MSELWDRIVELENDELLKHKRTRNLYRDFKYLYLDNCNYQKEIARLKRLLEEYGIDWREEEEDV